MKPAKRLPTTPLAKRFHAMYHRLPGTAWTEKEVKAYKDLLTGGSINLDELALVERFYRANWPPDRDKNHLRTNLLTLLLNYPGEVDKARVYCERHPLKAERKIIQLPPAKSEPWEPPSDPEEQAQLQRFLDQMANRGSAACQRLKNDQDQTKLDFGAL